MKREVTAEVDEETPKRGKRAEIYGKSDYELTVLLFYAQV